MSVIAVFSSVLAFGTQTGESSADSRVFVIALNLALIHEFEFRMPKQKRTLGMNDARHEAWQINHS